MDIHYREAVIMARMQKFVVVVLAIGMLYSFNPYLPATFNCHINVEVCTAVISVKYIYKYVYKGNDSASVELDSGRN